MSANRDDAHAQTCAFQSFASGLDLLRLTSDAAYPNDLSTQNTAQSSDVYWPHGDSLAADDAFSSDSNVRIVQATPTLSISAVSEHSSLTHCLLQRATWSLERSSSAVSTTPTTTTTTTASRHAGAIVDESLDISRISNRIVVASRCWPPDDAVSRGGQPLRNGTHQLAAFLNARYRDKYMLWNVGPPESLCPASLLQHRLIAATLPRSQLPTLKQLFHLCHSLLGWLQLDADNVAIIQCGDGRLRSGLLVSCLLRYAGAFESCFEAMDHFVLRRNASSRGHFLAAAPYDPRRHASVRRYLRYFNDTLVLAGRVPNSQPLTLHQVVITTVPNFDGEGGCRAGLELFRNNELIYAADPTCDSQADGEEMVLQDRHHIIFRLGDNLLFKDVQLHVFHCHPQTRQRTSIFSIPFNTGFMHSGVIRLRPADLELPLWDAPPPATILPDDSRLQSGLGRFDPAFSVDLIMLPCERDGERNWRGSFDYCSTVRTNAAKNIVRLVQFHPDRPDRSLARPLELQGHRKLYVRLALQLHNQDIHQAHAFLEALQKSSAFPALEAMFREMTAHGHKHESEQRRAHWDERSRVQEETRDEGHVKEQDGGHAEERDETHADETHTVERDEGHTDEHMDTHSESECKLAQMPLVMLGLKNLDMREDGEGQLSRPNSAAANERESVYSTGSSLAPKMAPPPPPPLPTLLPGGSLAALPPPPPPLPSLSQCPETVNPDADASRPRIKSILHWNELSSPSLERTVWKEFADGVFVPRLQLDLHEFEELFCICPGQDSNQPRKQSLEGSGGDVDSGAAVPLVLDIRRANNVGIGLARFYKRFPTEDALIAAIYSRPVAGGRRRHRPPREQTLSLDDLLTLKSILPTEDEMQALRVFEGPVERMGRAERFMHQISCAEDGLSCALDTRIFELTGPSDLQVLLDKFVALTDMLNCIRASPNLKLVLKAALDVGNLANYEYGRQRRPSQRVSAQGFTLDSLCRLHEVKSVDGGSNLLVFLVASLLGAHPETVALCDEFRDLEAMRHWSTVHLAAEYDELRQTASKLRFQLEQRISLQHRDSPRAEFWQESLTVVREFSNRLTAHQSTLTQFETVWTETRAYYFGQDNGEVQGVFAEVSGFLGTLHQFCRNFSAAVRQVQKQAQIERGRESRASIESLEESASELASTATSVTEAVAVGNSWSSLSASEPSLPI